MRLLAFIIGMVFILLIQICDAQVCNGSLGDPVVKIDFGSGTVNPGPPLAPGITTCYYTFAVPNDGQYTIASSTNGMHINGWWQVPDHTGNPGGYMMIVNASFAPDVFYKQSISGLCPGTTYEFAAWIMNLLTYKGIRPNITFSIETLNGVVLKSFNTGDIIEGGPTWKQYGLIFTTPINESSVVIKMSNNAPGGIGNDIALDDITFRACGPTLIAGLGSAGLAKREICVGNSQPDTLNGTTSAGYNHQAYQWQLNTGSGWSNIPGATSTQYIFNQPASAGYYQFRLASAEAENITSPGCITVSNTVILNVLKIPVAVITSNGPVICEGRTLSLSATGGTTYSWTDANGNPFSTDQNPSIPNITLAQAGKYTVTAYNGPCSSQASVNINVVPAIKAFVSRDTTICEGTSIQLIASGGVKYKWTPAQGLSNDGISNPVASPVDTTTYTVSISNLYCIDTVSVRIRVIKKPVISAGKTKTINQGQSVRLMGSVKGNYSSYYWSPANYLDNPTSLTPLATPPASIIYTLHVISTCAIITDSVKVGVDEKITVPNTFTPNGDGINDIWEIKKLNTYDESKLYIYNRNGELVYSSIGYSIPWNGTYQGKPLPVGVYYYVIDLKGSISKVSGYVTIIR